MEEAKKAYEVGDEELLRVSLRLTIYYLEMAESKELIDKWEKQEYLIEVRNLASKLIEQTIKSTKADAFFRKLREELSDSRPFKGNVEYSIVLGSGLIFMLFLLLISAMLGHSTSDHALHAVDAINATISNITIV